MSDDVKIGLDIDDNGSASRVEDDLINIKETFAEINKEASQFLKLLKETSNASEKAEKKTRGTSGSRAAAEAAQIGVLSRQRGTAELTGAAARDFSNQAQGLGGLVRLYATFAANVFALGAAFRSLSSSMDTDNMIKGLDQLGAAGGRNLGSLAKRLGELSGGAISTAEALRAVAQTSSGGMSNRNIERMAVVARNAATALGVAMPDAINRLSRGITKLEPELLDELGIMTRLEPALEIYARQVGKAVGQLTLFERRQAFANAVLAEGEEKFSAITGIAVNPYDRLVSSLKDVVQVGTSAVNGPLAAIAELLADSPTALATGLTAVAGILIKQALPALGEFKKGLEQSAIDASQVAKERAGDARKAITALSDELEAAQKRKEDTINDITAKQTDVLSEVFSKRGKILREESALYQVIKRDISEATQGDIKRTEAAARRLEKMGLKEEAAAIRVIKESIKQEVVAYNELEKAKERNAKALQDLSKDTSVFGASQRLAIEATNAATKKQIISNAAYNGSLVGVRTAHVLMNAEIEASGIALTNFQRRILVARGWLAALAGTISTVTTAFFKLTNFLAIGASLVAVFSILELAFSKNSKEAAEFDSAIEGVQSSIKNVNLTLEGLRKNSTQGTIQGIKALAEAFENLADAADLALKGALEKFSKGSFYDNFVNNLKRLFGKDTETVLAKQMSDVITGALELAGETDIGGEAKKKIEETLTRFLGVIDISNSEELQKAFSKLGTGVQTKVLQDLRKVSETLSNSAGRVDHFKLSLDNATLAYQQFIQTTSNNDPVFRVGAAMQNIAAAMFDISEASELSTANINAVILELGKAPEAAAIFGDDFVKGLLNIKDAFADNEKEVISLKKQIKDLDKVISSTPINELFVNSKDFTEEALGSEKRTITTLDKMLKDRKALEDKVATLTTKQATEARTLFSNALEESFRKGSELIRISLGQAMEKGALAISRAALAGLTGEGRARAEAGINQREIEIRLKAINTNLDLILSQEKLRAAIEHNTAEAALKRALDSGESSERIQELKQAVKVAETFSDLLEKRVDPTFENASRFTDDEDIAKRVAVRGVSTSQRIAEQEQAKILAEMEGRAAGLAGFIGIQQGRLEDLQKLLGLQSQMMQMESARIATVRQIVGFADKESIILQNNIDRRNLIIRQESEIAAINTAISIAQNDAEIAKQEGFKRIVQEKQEIERTNQELQQSLALINARLEALQRTSELARILNEEQFNANLKAVELTTAEVNAYAQLLNMTGEYAARQNEILGSQRAQVDFVRQTSEITTQFVEKATELNAKINALNPVDNADQIALLNEELQRQEQMAQSRIRAARTTLVTQQAILKVTRDTTIQQARYNRLLNATSNLGEGLSSAFGEFGSAIGKLTDSFAKLVVVSSQGRGSIERLHKAQVGVGKEFETQADKEKELAIQQDINRRNQLAGYASIAGAAKNMFEEQSAGYQALLAIERIFHLAHMAMAIARMAMDATATTASAANTAKNIAEDAAEAESTGVLAVVKAIASLPPPLNFIAGAATAAVVGALISSIGGSGPKAPKASGGFSAEDVQKVQGSGLAFDNGKLSTRSGGVFGASSEKVNDLVNALELIESNTSESSLFGMQMVSSLKKIELNTQALAGTVLAGSSIGSPLSGFGTVERIALPKTGLLSSFIPSTSKSVEIVDKGIQVVGQFRDILQQTADFLEFETVKTTKQKSGFLGIGAKTKISFSTNTKELGTEASEVIVNLFTQLANSAVSASKVVFGAANDSIEKTLEDFVVAFKVSGFGMSTQEFAEAILSESNVLMNQILEQSLPELNQFRKSGEGFTGTLIRLATTIESVSEKFRMFGSNMEFLNDTTVLEFSTSLVDAFGGLEEFTEQTNFLFENFMTTEEQLQAKTLELNRSFAMLGEEGILTQSQVTTLIDGVGNLRLEYRELLKELLSSGNIEALALLSKFAPAIVEVTDELDSAVNSLKSMKDLFKDSIGSLLSEASLGSIDPETLGEDVANVIREGFLTALSTKFVDDMTNAIVESLVTPVLEGALNMATTGGFVLTTSMDAIVDHMVERANALGQIITNPSFRQALLLLSTSVAKVVEVMNENARKATFIFSKLKADQLIKDIADLSKEIEERKLDDIIDAEQKRFDLLTEQADLLGETVSKLKDFSQSLKDFKQELLTGPLTPLTPLEQLDVAKKNFVDLFQTASSATATDEERFAALDKIQDAATTFLEASRLVYSSGPNFTENFNFVQSILDSLIGTTDSRLTIDEQQLNSLNAQLAASQAILDNAKAQKDLLSNIDNNLEDMVARLKKLQTELEAEFQIGRNQIVDSFTFLDKDLDGILTFEELQKSGMASDETLTKLFNEVDQNGNGQISRLEAIGKASQGTQFTLQSIVPILDSVNMGIITVAQGIAQVALVQGANKSVGGNLTGNIPAPTTGGVGFNNGSVSQSGAFIAANKVIGMNNLTANTAEAKSAILAMAAQIDAGTRPARDLYNLFKTWGASSSTVGSLLGMSASDVLAWFRARDASIPSFAQGINNVPFDMLAMIHKGERIFPKADNDLLMQNINQLGTTNKDIVEELRKIKDALNNLKETISVGDVMNAEATEKNAEVVSKNMKEIMQINEHISKLQARFN